LKTLAGWHKRQDWTRLQVKIVTETLDNHGKQLSNEYVEDLTKEIRQQKEKKEKDKESPLKCMKKM
jgi:hypothetical protein